MKLKKLAMVGGLIATTTLSAMGVSKNMSNTNPLTNKPYAEVEFAIEGSNNCKYQVLINDVPIYAGAGAMRASYPVNHYMINGQNNLAIAIKDTDSECKASATLQVRKLDESNNDVRILNKVEFSGQPSKASASSIKDSTVAEKLSFQDNKFKANEDGDIKVSKAVLSTDKEYYGYNYDTQKREYMSGVKVSQDIDLPISIPHWAWLDGETIENNQATKDALIAIYKTIWSDIQSKDWSKLNKLFALRDKEMTMLDGEKADTTAKIKATAEDSETKELWIPDGEKFVSLSFQNIYGNKKLVTLTQWSGKNFLGFKTNYGNTNYGLKFAKINGKFVIVR